MTYLEKAVIAAKYNATVAQGCSYKVCKPQRRWKYSTHSIYNPRKSWVKGRMPTEKTW